MAAPTAAGRMRSRIRFEKQVEQDDPGGGTLSEWVPQFSRSAEIRPLQGGEDIRGQRLAGSQPVLIMVRKDAETASITPAWRAVETVNGITKKTYAIKTAEDMEREGEFITMMAVAGAADG